MSALHILASEIERAPACVALPSNRAGIYRDHARRRHRLSPLWPPPPRPRAPLALSELERQALREVRDRDRFADCAPRAVYARLLDEGRYLGSVRTMYRLLAVSGQSRERRHQCVHPAYVKPELLAVQPNEVCPLCQERCRAGFSQIWGREMRVSRGNESEVFTRV